MLFDDLFVNRFPSFEGTEFRVSAWPNEMPFLFHAKPMGTCLDGVSVEMLKTLVKTRNVTFSFFANPTSSYWENFVNGSWTGVLGMVQRQEVNFSIKPFAMTPKRNVDFDPSIPYFIEGLGVALLSSLPPRNWESLFYPFASVIWMTVLSTILIASVILMLLVRYMVFKQYSQQAAVHTNE